MRLPDDLSILPKPNPCARNNEATPLMHLPDDLLILLLQHMRFGLCPRHRRCDGLHYDMEDFVNLTMCCKRLRALSARYLFRTIKLGRSWNVRHTINSLQLLQQSTCALAHVRELVVDLWAGCDQGIPTAELEVVGYRLANCLSQMGSLSKLSLSTTVAYGQPLRAAFDASAAEYPQLNELVVGRYVDWLVSFCPNVHTISSDDWIEGPWRKAGSGIELVRIASCVASIQHFTLNAVWDTDLLLGVWKAMPQLRSLGIAGHMSDLNELLKVLRHFRDLKCLALPDAARIGGLGVPVIESRWSSQRDITLAQGTVLHTCFRRLPQIEEIKLGRYFKAWAMRYRSDGSVQVAWEMQMQFRPGCIKNSSNLAEEHEIWIMREALDIDTASMLSLEDARSIYSRTDTLDA